MAYDDEAIYVAVWADDPRPDLIRALLTRRDVDGPVAFVLGELAPVTASSSAGPRPSSA